MRTLPRLLSFLESEVIFARTGSADQPSDGKVKAVVKAYNRVIP